MESTACTAEGAPQKRTPSAEGIEITFEALGKKLSVIGTMFGIHDVITNIKQYQNTDDREEKWLVGSDIGPAFSIAWTFGLDDCVKQQIIYLFEN